jgi:hypothetical protein
MRIEDASKTRPITSCKPRDPGFSSEDFRAMLHRLWKARALTIQIESRE